MRENYNLEKSKFVYKIYAKCTQSNSTLKYENIPWVVVQYSTTRHLGHNVPLVLPPMQGRGSLQLLNLWQQKGPYQKWWKSRLFTRKIEGFFLKDIMYWRSSLGVKKTIEKALWPSATKNDSYKKVSKITDAHHQNSLILCLKCFPVMLLGVKTTIKNLCGFRPPKKAHRKKECKVAHY